MDDWLRTPGHEHGLHIYRKQDELITNLALYISEGLRTGDACILLATTEHIVKLEGTLRLMPGIDLAAAAGGGQYLVVDAERALKFFMVNGMPDEARFHATIGRLVRDYGRDTRKIRIYGEMVALLWRSGNARAVLQLEDMWNRMGHKTDFALLCAYPELHFIFDRSVRRQVSRRHAPNLTDDKRKLPHHKNDKSHE